MTDSRVSRATAQALTLGTPDSRVSRATAQALTLGTPDSRVSRSIVQILVSYGGAGWGVLLT